MATGEKLTELSVKQKVGVAAHCFTELLPIVLQSVYIDEPMQ